MTVAALRESISQAEFVEWGAFYAYKAMKEDLASRRKR